MFNFKEKKRIVIKIGSALIVKDGKIRRNWLNALAEDISDLKQDHEFIIVSSGAIAMGCSKLDVANKNLLTIEQKQAMSTIGQIDLMNEYDKAFENYSLNIGQILLTASDCNIERRIMNFRNTVKALFDNNAVPIINENDSVAIAEIKIGDNDTLAAYVADIIDADLMILFSDVDGLYDSDPNKNKSAKFIDVVDDIDNDIIAIAGDSNSNVGTGGMATKIKSAQILEETNCDTIITSGLNHNCLKNLISGSQKYTLFQNKII